MSQEDKKKAANKQTQRVVLCTVGINILNTVLKLAVGVGVSSMALITDGLHSLSDMITDVVVLAGAQIGLKEPDDEHPYGHAWAETFATLFVAITLAVAGCFMIYKAGMSIAMHKVSQIGRLVLTIAGISIFTKEFAFVITKRTAVKLSSSMLYANAWHHRSDALSSIAVAIGAVASMLGFAYGDQIAAIIVGLMIVVVAVRILSESMGQFTARAVDAQTNEQITRIIKSQTQIHDWHKLRTRVVGRELFMDLHILVAPKLNITEAHDIAEALENELHEKIIQPVNIMIHVEPYTKG
ncbi:MAG: cation transporter [Sedimentisphaerales bacterium]|nr:cation transporter [Sedimentisphaerales bacterium]